MSQETLEFIEHHGTKGMKWGVRKDASRADKQWAKNVYSVPGAIAVHNEVANMMNYGGLERLNKAHPKAHLDHDTPATRAYVKAYEKMATEFTTKAIQNVHGTSPSGGYKATLKVENGEGHIVIEATDVKHAGDFSWETLVIPLEIEDGRIVGARKIKKEVLKQSNTENFIQHYGKKGMKWGVRSSRKQVKTSSDFKKTAPHRGKKPSELTNKQLKAVNERMNLEQNYRRMNPNTVKKGQNVAKGLMGLATAGITIYSMVHSPAGKAFISTGKAALARHKLATRLAIDLARTKQGRLPGM